MTNAERRQPPAWVRGTQQTPQVPLRNPVDRHDPRRIRPKSPSRPGERNTIIDPNVVSDAQIQADLDAINRGEAIVDRQHATAWINGRLWGYHTDTGTAYPMRGEGFLEMNQQQYSALRMVVRYNGLNDRSERELMSRPNLTDEDRDLVRHVWRIREKAKD